VDETQQSFHISKRFKPTATFDCREFPLSKQSHSSHGAMPKTSFIENAFQVEMTC
jgi:hypothetical protein